jgi:hypothetical protein
LDLWKSSSKQPRVEAKSLNQECCKYKDIGRQETQYQVAA